MAILNTADNENCADKRRRELEDLFISTRQMTAKLAASLEPEDMMLQAMPDASPTKWHLAHTTWFFEQFILEKHERNFSPYHSQYSYFFNSYYETVGDRWRRADRGLLSRPSVREVWSYRAAIDERVLSLLSSAGTQAHEEIRKLVTLGIQHEKQHQELLCTDIKSVFGLNPMFPAAFPKEEAVPPTETKKTTAPLRPWRHHKGGLHDMGHAADDFCFDNEQPRHQVWLEDFALRPMPVTAGEFLDFMEDGGYSSPHLWLADGWDWVNRNEVNCPLYWHHIDGQWHEFTLHGLIPLSRERILSHVSAYEAFAFASWSGARLPYEAELEVALKGDDPHQVQWLDPSGSVHPGLAGDDQALNNVYGSVWGWTQSAYSAYPGYQPQSGAIGEYNGKFMSAQLVLKGGSCATPPDHIRPTYRNFFPAHARWQFTGIRLARSS